MDITKLLPILTDLQKDFSTIKKVEINKEQTKINIILKDFSPKNEEKTHELTASYFEDPVPSNDLAQSYQKNWKRIEIFYIAGTYSLESSDLNFVLKYLSEISLGYMGVRVNLLMDYDDNTGSILCRSVIPLMKDPDNIREDVLLALKDLLAMHCKTQFNNAVVKLKETGLDEDTEKAVISKYKTRLEHLINPITEL